MVWAKKKTKKRVGKPFGKPTLSSRGEMAIYLIMPILAVVILCRLAQTPLPVRLGRPTFKHFWEHHFSCVVPN